LGFVFGPQKLPVSGCPLLQLVDDGRRTTMKDQNVGFSGRKSLLNRRTLLRSAAGTMLGAGLFHSKWVFAGDHNDDDDSKPMECVGPNPIPGGVTALAPYGIFVHHNPLNPANPLASIHDPSQITDFDGFVGLTHIRGGGTGTDSTGATMSLAYQADMGFSQGKFIGTDARVHHGTQVFV